MQLITSPFWPFAVLVIGIISVALMISKFKIHPFISLILTSIIVGMISPALPVEQGVSHLLTAVELPMKEFGIMAGKITWVIALAAIIGVAMMQSGAASKIVDKLITMLGESKAALALLICGFILSIPVFFDTVFFLLIPLAIALAQKTGKNFVLYVVAIAGGAVITHSLVPPTPGPLIMAETLQIDLGITILAGIGFGIIPASVALWLAHAMNKKLEIPVRLDIGTSASLEASPSFFLSLLPVILPIGLISAVSISNVTSGFVPDWLAFLGNKNIAMGIGTAIALYLWMKFQNLKPDTLWKNISKPLEVAGVIILITCAGGAFGSMIKHSGIGSAIELATADLSISYILLAWIISAVMKTAQGSSTVAMITASSIIFSIIGAGADLPYHPIYILLAIGFGAGFISWMNDSGFWVVSRMSGFTEKETFSTWTLMFASVAVTGLLEVLVMSMVFPMV